MNLFDRSSLALISDAAKDGKLYSIRPTDGSGDFTFSRGSDLTATRVDENGLIEKGRENFLLESNNFDEVWNKSSSNVTSSQAGYDGTTDAWSVSKTAQFGRLEQTVVLSGLTTMSVYAKASTNDWIAMRHSADGSSIANFDLTNGVFGAIGSNVVATNSVSVGSGWYRVSVIWNYTGSSGVRIHPGASDNIGGTTATIFIQDVQVEQGLVATDYMDTSTGVNKLLYSNNFEKSAWPVGTHYTVTPDQEGHDGTTNAYLLNKTSGGNDYFRQMDVNVDGQATTSIYAKAGTVNHLMIYLNGYIRVNLSNGDVESTGGVFESYNVERIGRNGWWRISLTIASHPNFVYFKPQIGNNVDGIGSIYIQHAQTNEGADTLPYVETQGTTAYAGVLENLPRIDYTGGTQSLLLEPSRTNVIGHSEYANAGSGSSATITDNVTTSPEGVQNAARLLPTSGFGRWESLPFGSLITNGTTYVVSAYFNTSSTIDIITFYIGWNGATGGDRIGIKFNPNTRVYISTFSMGSATLTDYDIGEADENGWYRVSLIAPATNANSSTSLVLRDLDSQADGSKYVDFYGLQMEAGSYPTSYIPTYGTAATRGVDFFDSSADFTSFFGKNQGIIFIETNRRLGKGESSNQEFIGFREDSSGNYWRILARDQIIYVQSVGWGSTITHYPYNTNPTKYLFKWDGTTTSFYIDGSLIGSGTQTATFSPNAFGRSGGGVSAKNQEFLKHMTLFPEALSDKDCRILTGSYPSFAAMASALNYTVYE